MDNDGVINEEEWVLGMSVFLRGTVPEQAGCMYQNVSLNLLPDDNILALTKLKTFAYNKCNFTQNIICF